MLVGSQAALLLSLFFLPLSTAGLNIGVVLSLVLWLLSGTVKKSLRMGWRNPLVLACSGLFGLLLVGVFYPGVPWKDALHGLLPYRKLIFVIPLLFLFSQPFAKAHGLRPYLLAMAITLALSYLHSVWPFEWAFHSRRGEYWDHAIFKHHIIQNMFMTFLVVPWVIWNHQRPKAFKNFLFWIGLFVICFNVWIMVHGRTGHLCLAMVLLWLIWCYAPTQQRTKMLLGSIVLGVALGAFLFSSQTRFSKIAEEISIYEKGKLEGSPTGQRLEFWKQSYAALKERPILGWGTGSYSGQYCKRGASKLSCEIGAYNPHNQYVFLAVQLGVVGLLAYLSFLVYLFVQAQKLPLSAKFMAGSTLLMLAIHSLFDSPLFVVTEGHFYILLLSYAFASWPTQAVLPITTTNVNEGLRA